MNEKQLVSIVDTYKDKRIPIDNYTLDFDWKAWGEDNYGEFRWNTANFPDGPTGVLKDMMVAKGIKLTAATKAINLRYSLMPYIYTYDRQAYDTGIGLVRPLIFDYPQDDSTANYVDAWMFGENLLVSPVVDQGQTEKEIYLPKGTWLDYFNGTSYEGGQKISYKINSNNWDDIPLFIKKGAIIPSNTKAIQNTDEKIDSLYLDAFPNTTESSFKYYDDDGKTYNYEKGEYLFQNMKAQDKGTSITFKIDKKEGSYTSNLKYYICKIHGSGAKDVKLGGKSLSKGESLETLMSADNETWVTGKDVYGEVTFVKVTAQEEKSIEIIK